MFCKLSKNSQVERILLVSLSNIGDIVMTFPVFDTLRETFPRASISVIVGPKGKSFFCSNPYVHSTIIFDKAMSWVERWHWLDELRHQHFDLIVDLRNSMLPFFVRAACSTHPELWPIRCHMKEKHLRRLFSVVDDPVVPRNKYAGFLSARDLQDAWYIVYGLEGFILFAPGAADKRKRWSEDGFAKIIRYVMECHGRKVVIVGDKRDRPAAERILRDVPSGVVNLCGFTSITELMGVVRRAGMAVTNDSGIMHLASYFDIPTVALFGPTDPFLYEPWSSQKAVIWKGEEMAAIKPEDVIKVMDDYLSRTYFVENPNLTERTT